jgi:hypothetical protein
MTTMPPVSTVLPWGARETLRRAATVMPTASDPLAREKAIEAAIARIKLQYPKLFIQEI